MPRHEPLQSADERALAVLHLDRHAPIAVDHLGDAARLGAARDARAAAVNRQLPQLTRDLALKPVALEDRDQLAPAGAAQAGDQPAQELTVQGDVLLISGQATARDRLVDADLPRRDRQRGVAGDRRRAFLERHQLPQLAGVDETVALLDQRRHLGRARERPGLVQQRLVERVQMVLGLALATRKRRGNEFDFLVGDAATGRLDRLVDAVLRVRHQVLATHAASARARRPSRDACSII